MPANIELCHAGADRTIRDRSNRSALGRTFVASHSKVTGALKLLNAESAARLPRRIRFTRDSRRIYADRKEIGVVEVRNHRLMLSDADLPASHAMPLPIEPPNGLHRVYVYQWMHPNGPMNVCAVISFRTQLFATTRLLAIANAMRPDLTEGVIVDSGAVRIGGISSQLVSSGLGDGYYPVFAMHNFGFLPQAIVVDFEIWKVRNLILQDHQELDEYGIVHCKKTNQ